MEFCAPYRFTASLSFRDAKDPDVIKPWHILSVTGNLNDFNRDDPKRFEITLALMPDTIEKILSIIHFGPYVILALKLVDEFGRPYFNKVYNNLYIQSELNPMTIELDYNKQNSLTTKLVLSSCGGEE